MCLSLGETRAESTVAGELVTVVNLIGDVEASVSKKKIGPFLLVAITSSP